MNRTIRVIQSTLLALAFGAGLILTLPATASPAAPTAVAQKAPKAQKQLTGKVNINTATEAELELLPGIGPAKSKRIVGVRGVRRYNRPADLVKVKGIGPKTVKKLMPYLSVTGPTTLKKQ